MLCTVPRGGRLVGEELVAHGEAKVVVEPLVAVVEVVEADGGRHGGTLADEHRPGRARVHRAAELPAAAAEMPVGDLEVAVGAAAVVVRLEPAQLELLERDLQGMNGRHREKKLLVGLLQRTPNYIRVAGMAMDAIHFPISDGLGQWDRPAAPPAQPSMRT